MSAVIIRKKDVERLGKEVLKEMNDFLHDERILSKFEEMKEVQKNFLKNLVLFNFRNFNVTKIQKGNLCKIKYEELDENEFENELKCVKDKINNGTLNTYVIFETLKDIDFVMEINEDLYSKKCAFVNIFKVINSDYTYLED